MSQQEKYSSELLWSYSVKKLKSLCKTEGLTRYSTLTKEKLIKKLQQKPVTNQKKHQSKSFDSFRMTDLKKMCKNADIDPSKKKKQEIIGLLIKNRNEQLLNYEATLYDLDSEDDTST